MAASCISCVRKLALIAITVRALVTELLHLRCGHLEQIFEGVAVTSGEAAVDAELFRVILGETSVANRNVLFRFFHAFECVAGIAGGDLPEDTDQIVGLRLLSDGKKLVKVNATITIAVNHIECMSNFIIIYIHAGQVISMLEFVLVQPSLRT